MPTSSAARKGPALPLAVLLAVSLTGSAVGAEGLVLRYHHTPGDTARYEYALSSRAQAKEEGGETIRAEVSLQMQCLVEFLGDTASGDWGILGKIPSGVMKVKVQGEEATLDFGSLTSKYVVTPRGEVRSFKILSGDPPVLQFGGGALVLGPEDAFLLSGVGIFPEKPLKKGDRWKGVARLPTPESGRILEIAYESVLLGEAKSGGVTCQKIKTSARQTVEHSTSDPNSGAEAQIALSSSTETTWLFDPARGLIVSSDSTHNVIAAANLVASCGKRASVKTNGVVNSRAVLREFNGRPASAD